MTGTASFPAEMAGSTWFLCRACQGSGEGLHEGTRCIRCRGLGEIEIVAETETTTEEDE